MKRYIIYDNLSGVVVRSGLCSNTTSEFLLANHTSVLIGAINDDKLVVDDSTQKIINNKVFDKTPAEIAADKTPEPPPTPYNKQQKISTNEEYQSILDRLEALENLPQ